MRITIFCMQCFQERGRPDSTAYPAELQDNGLYQMVCKNGHETFTCVQEQKFEVLFELALNAIVDGYYREAVASFSSSLERFYEFYLQVMCVKRGLDDKTIERAWRAVSKQSERQLGAYAFTYLLENGDVAPILPENRVAFRNDVIHKGKVPSRDEAIVYGESVLQVISPILEHLKKTDEGHVRQVVQKHITNTRQGIEGTPHVAFMSIPTTISITRPHTEPQQNVEVSLTRLRNFRRRTGWSKT